MRFINSSARAASTATTYRLPAERVVSERATRYPSSSETMRAPAGSALGALVGSAATSTVDESEITVYFGLMLLGGSLVVAVQELGELYGIELFQLVSLLLILGSALLVSSAIVSSSVRNLCQPHDRTVRTAD